MFLWVGEASGGKGRRGEVTGREGRGGGVVVLYN